MKIVGLIAEYNPFHNGHRYHIQKAKEITGADYAVVIMSGDFVQRGTPALLPKHLRAEMALLNGADAVFELPVCYSTGSAELFAEGAVSFLTQLHVIDALCFGSESKQLASMQKIAEILSDEPEAYRYNLKESLKNGLSFPAARQNAIIQCMSDETDVSILKQPNVILGIEYLKALYKFHSPIQPYTIQRKESGYHDTVLKQKYSSASAIRHVIADSQNMDEAFNELADQVPASSMKILKDHFHVRYPVYQNDFSLLLKYQLLQYSAEKLETYQDVTFDLANRIQRELGNYLSFDQYCELLKTKDLTYTRVNRALTHILLGIQKADVQYFQDTGYHHYAKLLGFRRQSQPLLTAINKNSSLKLFTRCADLNTLSIPGQKMMEKDLFASNLYESVITQRYHTTCRNEFQKPVIKTEA